jgi:alpha-L-rhamnosidase
MNTPLQPTGLMCDLLAYPECTRICNRKPRFGWIVHGLGSNVHQQAFQVLVASNTATLEEDRGDMWDSGKPDPGKVWESDARSISVPYDGLPLESHSTYCWKVRIWVDAGEPGPWSEPQVFRTGELGDEYATPGYPLETSETRPLRFVRLDMGRYFIDFGRAAFGTIRFTVDSPVDGEMEVHLGEVLHRPYAINRNPGGSRRYRRLAVEIRKGRHEYQVLIPPDRRNTGPMAVRMPDDLFEVYPFRYCEIIGAPAPLRSDDIRRVEVQYRFDDAAQSFVSSSRTLNDVWELCRYTMKATSFCGLYVDGDRERIPYEADAYINQLGHYGADREYTLARRTHEYLITTPTWPTEWHLFSVLLAWNDYMYTGDERSIVKYYRDLEAKTLSTLAREDGLLDSRSDRYTQDLLEALHFAGRPAELFSRGISDIVDWPQVERDGYEMRPVNSVVNALHYRALLCMAGMAEAVDRREDASGFRRSAARVKRAYQKLLVDPDTGLVVDGEGSTHSALHANAFALACGLVPDTCIERVSGFLRTKGMACSVYASQMLLEAWYAAGVSGGHGADALSLLTATGERSWAHMVYDVGTTIALEAWDDRLKPNQDWNHAWGAAPAGMIPRGLMGILPTKPGFEEVLIRPQPGTLRWARIETPTIRGPIRVEFEQDPGSSFTLYLELPGNMTATVVVPPMGNPDPTVSVDGRTVVGVRNGFGVTVGGIGSGNHALLRVGTSG